jgi:small subunit ribosomal protein S1
VEEKNLQLSSSNSELEIGFGNSPDEEDPVVDIFGDDDSGQNQGDFAKMLAQSLAGAAKKFEKGDKVNAQVLSIGKEEIFFTLGPSQEGVAPKSEFRNEDGSIKIQVGDAVDLYIVNTRDTLVQLSAKPSSKALGESLEDAFDFGTPVEGRVTEVVNGGFRVQVFHKLAFCPISQMDTKPITDGSVFLNKKFEFIITKFEGGGRNIVVSRRQLLNQEREANAGLFLEEKKAGEILPGVITRLEAYGAFVEIAPGLEGLCHISEVSWSHLAHPSEAVVVGQKVSAKILKMEDLGGNLKISLSIKQAENDPWSTIDSQFEVGQVVKGKVTKCLAFGAFVEIAPGIEGLIPLGEMSYQKRVVKSDELVKPKDEVLVMIKSINRQEKRISLSLRDADGDPWLLVSAKFPAGHIFNGRITRKEKYGTFVELEPGVVGLMPKSATQDALDYNIEHKKVGDTVQAQVAEINLAERKISLRPPSDATDINWKSFNTGASTSGFGTLGDQLKGLLDTKKKL